MLSTPMRSEAEVAANATFDALLWALSRPGLVREMPNPGEAPIIDALLDRECKVHSADPLLLPKIMRTGAEVAEIDAADHVFLGRLMSADPLAEVRIGSDLYPDDGATVIVQANLGASLGDGQKVRMSGPGIDGRLDVELEGLPVGFWAARAARIRYPMGFDLFFVDGPRVMGLPRSTVVEVL